MTASCKFSPVDLRPYTLFSYLPLYFYNMMSSIVTDSHIALLMCGKLEMKSCVVSEKSSKQWNEEQSWTSIRYCSLIYSVQ
jgi:hypothetical protein